MTKVLKWLGWKHEYITLKEISEEFITLKEVSEEFITLKDQVTEEYITLKEVKLDDTGVQVFLVHSDDVGFT